MTDRLEKAMPEEEKDRCLACGKEMSSGVWTDGDGYGSDAKFVGIEKPTFGPYCWDCYNAGKAPNLKEQITTAFLARGYCGYLIAYVGRCRNKKPCPEHKDSKCWKCGQPAVAHCSVASSLVCGVPYCVEHPHEPTHYH